MISNELNNGYYPYASNTLSCGLQKCINRGLVPSAPVFLDLGAGKGEIVFRAAREGFHSYGIEFHQDFVDSAWRMISLKKLHDELPETTRCSVVQGSYYPQKYIERRASRSAVALAHEDMFWQLLPGDGGGTIFPFSYEDAKKDRVFHPVSTKPDPYKRLGISLSTVDVFFSYTWGPELPSQLELFSLYAKPSAIFLNDTAEEPYHHPQLLEELGLQQEMLLEWQRPSRIGLKTTCGLMLYRTKN
ncbi:hypothetical protein HZC31_07775 [Candidatus Woesearchaeota archaeon]|nr:hypothetical protein [Candidatus Woesearchaeota archaeon]